MEANIGSFLPIAGEITLEAANEEDLKKQPLIVKGYLGPGLSLDAPLLGTEGAAKLLYLVDPRVVSGSAWVTGANEAGKHVFGLVAGRDFGWDGVIECTEVRAGDEAPDGSGPLETARGIEMGHIFQLGRKYAEALELKVLDQNGKQVVVTMGSYGVGVTRAVAALAESNHDDKGLDLAARRRPGRCPRRGRGPRRGNLRRRGEAGPRAGSRRPRRDLRRPPQGVPGREVRRRRARRRADHPRRRARPGGRRRRDQGPPQRQRRKHRR